MKKIKASMWQCFPYSKKWVENIVTVLHIYGDLSIFIIFCDHQDTESK